MINAIFQVGLPMSIWLFVCVVAAAQDRPSNLCAGEEPIGYLNWSTKTMGGRQVWTDVKHFDGWRIQLNHVTGHHRLLDPNDFRHAWGNLPHCELKLNQVAEAEQLKPYSGKMVVLLHGLNRSHASMLPMAKCLRENGYQVLNFQYASSRATIGDHATALSQIIDGFGDGVTEINFVGHSMGNLVVRHYLHNTRNELTGEEGDSRIGRMVMIGPPNQGSRMARLMKYSGVFNLVTGASGAQLSTNWERLEPLLSKPRFQFGILAGGQAEDSAFSNPLLAGRDDFTVSVEEAKLEGAHDFIVRPWNHTGMMKNTDAMELTLRFLKRGFFVAEEQRQPIVREFGE